MANPTTWFAQFSTDLTAQTPAGATLPIIDAGAPAVTGAPWGVGSWGNNGPWGQWGTIQLQLATSDIVTIPPAYLSPKVGGLAFQLTRHFDSGSTEMIAEFGADLSDWMKIFIDSSDKLNLWWSSGGALPQYLVSAQSIATGVLYTVTADWQHINQRMTITSLDVAPETLEGLRDVPVGSWGAGNLLLRT